jgi:hypothetical protein
VPRRKVQPGLLSPADAADLSARLDWLEQRAVVAATGGILLTEGPGGTVVRGTATPYTPPPFSGVAVYNSNAGFSVNDSTLTDYSFTNANNYTDRYWDSGSPSLITIPRDGFYLFTATVAWQANANGDRWVELSDTTPTTHAAAAGKPNSVSTKTSFTLAVSLNAGAGAVFKLRMLQTSGGAISVLGGTLNTHLEVVRLGDLVTAFA